MTTQPTSPRPPATVENLLLELEDWFVALKEAKAGYCKLMEAHDWVEAGCPPARVDLAKLRFLFAASATGHDSRTPSVELGEIAFQERPWFLIPQIRVYEARIDEALGEIVERIEMVRAGIAQRRATEQPQPQPQA